MFLIWTDGSCYPNPGAGGWGWHRNDGGSAFGGELLTTNNRMEMAAILNALAELPSGSVAVIYSDSQYCIRGLTTWRAGWKRKNWMKKSAPMLNRDLWVAFEPHLARLSVKFRWVRGHNGDPGNIRADKLANQGRAELVGGVQ